MAANGTTWKPGQSGNPKGRPPQERSMAAMLKDKPDALEQVATKLMDLALEGDIRAIRLVLEYVDGRPAPIVQVQDSDDNQVGTKIIYLEGDRPAVTDPRYGEV